MVFKKRVLFQPCQVVSSHENLAHLCGGTAGEFDTVVIKPLMKSEGIFNKKGDVYIWLTDDKKRVPVKLESKVAIGSITATLAGGTF